MSAPRVPASIRVGGRIRNNGNPLRVRMWNSQQPAAAWFATIFSPVKTDVTAEGLLASFPDASYVAVARCMQEVVHIHAVVALCNLYSREKVLRKMREAFGGATRASRMRVEVCPVYNSMPATVRYIVGQLLDDSFSQVVIGDPMLMGSYGNAWAKEYTGDSGAGVTARKLTGWSRQGFPPYAVNTSPLSQAAAMRASVAFNKDNGWRRGHHNANVRVVYAHNGDGTEPIVDCYNYLMRLFGCGRAAMPFVYDARGIIGPFTVVPFPGYTGQPGVVLFVSGNYMDIAAQRETVAGLQRREGAYGNVEALWVVVL